MIIKQNVDNSPYGRSDDSGNMQHDSHILIEESIEEMRNRSDIYDPSISVNNVVDELTEIILATETFEAIDEYLYIREQREQDNGYNHYQQQ